jgi:cytochrome b561
MNVQTAGRYNNLAIALHWVVAVLVLVMIGLGIYMTDIPRGTPDRSYFYNLHKSIGLTTGIIVLFRLWWRRKNHPMSGNMILRFTDGFQRSSPHSPMEKH